MNKLQIHLGLGSKPVVWSVSYLSPVNKCHFKPEVFMQHSAHPHLPCICFLTLAGFTWLNDQLLWPHLYMYLPSCYVFARWARVSLPVPEGLLTLASGQPGYPAHSGRTGRDRKGCRLLPAAGRRKVSGCLYPLIAPTSSGLCLGRTAFINATINNQLMNNQTYQLSFYVFSICWTSFGYLTSMPLIVFRLLWMLRCWASADYCKSNSRFPYAPSVRVTHGNRTKPFQQPEMGAALSRPYLKTIHFTFHLAEASWDKPRYTEMQSCDNHLTFFIVRKYSLILKWFLNKNISLIS